MFNLFMDLVSSILLKYEVTLFVRNTEVYTPESNKKNEIAPSGTPEFIE